MRSNKFLCQLFLIEGNYQIPNMNRFENKVVVITGAAGGIGEATTRRIVSEGGKVVIADHSEKRRNSLPTNLLMQGPTCAMSISPPPNSRVAKS